MSTASDGTVLQGDEPPALGNIQSVVRIRSHGANIRELKTDSASSFQL